MTHIASTNPADNYSIIGSLESTLESDIILIVDRAKQSQQIWADMPIPERVRILRELYDDFVAHTESIAQSVANEMGMPIRLAREEV